MNKFRVSDTERTGQQSEQLIKEVSLFIHTIVGYHCLILFAEDFLSNEHKPRAVEEATRSTI